MFRGDPNKDGDDGGKGGNVIDPASSMDNRDLSRRRGRGRIGR